MAEPVPRAIFSPYSLSDDGIHAHFGNRAVIHIDASQRTYITGYPRLLAAAVQRVARLHGVTFTPHQLSQLQQINVINQDIEQMPAWLDTAPSQRFRLPTGIPPTSDNHQLDDYITAITHTLIEQVVGEPSALMDAPPLHEPTLPGVTPMPALISQLHQKLDSQPFAIRPDQHAQASRVMAVMDLLACNYMGRGIKLITGRQDRYWELYERALFTTHLRRISADSPDAAAPAQP
ncbi:hypothetical protein LRS06_03835 [Hymenobacter sp. J193]|uniref:hypothetical protein n=1 Tax=Hymenobacter sp. J193 TaxID=2898429 RepID=UPI002150E0BC|nr:hypothetical protein [Hymenobacter sp. J193]MCR5886919.1 hypothetical protein [Hymenobacter sp. J193]